MINTKFLLIISLLAINIVYYFLFSSFKIFTLIVEEYIFIGITFLMWIIYRYFKFILNGKQLFEFIPNTNYIELKSTIIFFLIFEVVDFYMEDGLIGMISLWFSYWLFGVLAYLLTHNINFYKNYKAYQLKE